MMISEISEQLQQWLHLLWHLLDPVLLSLLISTIICFLFLVKKRSVSKRQILLPSPRKLPVIGNLHQLGALPFRSLASLAGQYGPLMLLHCGSVPVVIVSSAQLAKQVMKTYDHVFSSRPPSKMADILLYGSDVAFLPYGEKWRQLRRISIVHLLSNKRVQSYELVRREEVASMVAQIRATRGVVNLSEMLAGLTCDIVCRVALGRKYSNDRNSPRRILNMFVELLGSFPFGDFIPWLGWIDKVTGLEARAKKVAAELDRFIEAVLKDHEAKKRSNDGGSMVDVLLSLDENENEGAPLSRESIKGTILDMFAAGTDTVATAIQWTMGELVKHPEQMKNVQNEIRKVVGAKETIEVHEVNQMSYMRAAVKEALRLHPPIPLLIPRESMEKVQLDEHEIPAGTRIVVNAWAISRDPTYWHEPNEFRPQRFVNNNVDFMGQDFQFIPFGAGRRGCPGIHFAIGTIELAVANLLYYFDWAMTAIINPMELDLSEVNGITVHMKSDLLLLAK